MKNLNKMPMWRKALIVLFIIIAVSGFAAMGLIGDIKSPEYTQSDWSGEDNNIGNFSKYKDLYDLPENERKLFLRRNKEKLKKYGNDYSDYMQAATVLYNNKKFVDIFGKEIFNSTNEDFANTREAYEHRVSILEDIATVGDLYWRRVEQSNTNHNEYGDLIQTYVFPIDDNHNIFDGQIISLNVYDITPKLNEENPNQIVFYNFLYNSMCNDTTSLWKSTKAFLPFLALTTGPRVSISFGKDGRDTSHMYQENILVFANNRIYSFNFRNDKYNNHSGMAGFNMFDKKCISLVKTFDFDSYFQWEAEQQQIEKNKQRAIWGLRLSFYAILLSVTSLFFLCMRRTGKKNLPARNWTYYIILCFVIALLCMAIIVNLNNIVDTLFFLLFFILYTIICSIMHFYLTKKSHEEYNKHFLIPLRFQKAFRIRSEFTRRLLLIFLFYPLFLFVPIPIINLYSLAFYILPVLLVLGIIWIILWLKAGWKIESQANAHEDKKARLYCRHCGKLIDANSDYCRYCGKKL